MHTSDASGRQRRRWAHPACWPGGDAPAPLPTGVGRNWHQWVWSALRTEDGSNLCEVQSMQAGRGAGVGHPQHPRWLPLDLYSETESGKLARCTRTTTQPGPSALSTYLLRHPFRSRPPSVMGKHLSRPQVCSQHISTSWCPDPVPQAPPERALTVTWTVLILANKMRSTRSLSSHVRSEMSTFSAGMRRACEVCVVRQCVCQILQSPRVVGPTGRRQPHAGPTGRRRHAGA